MGLFSKSEHETEDEYSIARRRMVERQIAGRDVLDPNVLEVMARVPRHLFVDSKLRSEAYDDNPLPIGCGQTISQPYIVASMTEHLHPSKNKEVLEIGTGSGYQTAVLAELFGRVDTVEYYAELSRAAQDTLNRLGYANITFHVGDGLVIPDRSYRFDAIIVTAAPEKFPELLAERLKPDGRLVIPIGGEIQDLQLVVKRPDGELSVKNLYPVRFVPLLRRNL
jgi:protein-L-isoaspartate(D-aspartate) O-methyltransferase